jgi:hypothetical protein
MPSWAERCEVREPNRLPPRLLLAVTLATLCVIYEERHEKGSRGLAWFDDAELTGRTDCNYDTICRLRGRDSVFGPCWSMNLMPIPVFEGLWGGAGV